jgi:hypothetical protein
VSHSYLPTNFLPVINELFGGKQPFSAAALFAAALTATGLCFYKLIGPIYLRKSLTNYLVILLSSLSAALSRSNELATFQFPLLNFSIDMVP